MIPAAFAPVLGAMDRRLDPSDSAPLAVAFSGGGDSLALLHLARGWTQRTRRPLLALTVDHGLDPGSGRWTAQAGATARGLGAAWRALPWIGPKPLTGLPSAARAARHALLAEAARESGASVVLIGHTADDVAESELIRRETPAHGRMAEWSPSPAWPQGRGVFLLRPLLSVLRVELRAWLEGQGSAWLDDPANADPRYARTRARAWLQHAGASPSPVRPDVLLASSGEGESGWCVEVDPAAALTLHVEDLLACSRPEDVLAKAVLCASGGSRPPSGSALKRAMGSLAEGRHVGCTIGGARLQLAGASLRITRELGRQPPPPLDLPQAVAMVFDGRFELTASAPGLRVAALAGHAAALPHADRKALSALPADVRPALPVLLADRDPPRLPAPYGGGSAEARPLAATRLLAALGGVPDERALRATSRSPEPDGARRPLILS